MDRIVAIARWVREAASNQDWLSWSRPSLDAAPDWVFAALGPAVALLLAGLLFMIRRQRAARSGASGDQNRSLGQRRGAGTKAPPQGEGGLRFFVSRAGADKDVALAIKSVLCTAGHYATTQEDFRGSFIEGMHTSLGKDFYVVALLSNAYLRSSHCSAEWQQPLASDPLNTRSRLIIFRLEHVEPEGLLAPLIYTDLTSVLDDNNRLRDAVLRGLPTHSDDSEVKLGPLKKGDKRAGYAQVVRDAINAAITLLNAGEWSKAKSAFESALQTSQEQADDVAVTEIKCSLALIALRADNDLDTADRLLTECMEALSRKGSDPLRADVLSTMALLHEARDDLERAEVVQRQELAIRRRLPDKISEAGTLLQLAWTVGRGGNTSEAADLNKAAYASLVEGMQNERDEDTLIHGQGLMANLFFQRAKISQRAADPDGASRALTQALEWQRKNPPNHELAKLLREMGELCLFRRDLTEGLQLISEAAQIYADRELWRELAECLELMGRVHANAEKRDSAKKLFEESARVALRSSEPSLAATAFQDLAQLASEEGDSEAARAHLEEARRISPEPEVQAECLMRLASMARRDGDDEERERLIGEAIGIVRGELDQAGMHDLERADKLFTLGYYLREVGRLEEALAPVERARGIFERAGALSGLTKASFEAAGILDRLGRRTEARATCETLRKLVANTPLFEIRAAVELSLARFAESDGDLEEAEAMTKRAIDWCREHELPMVSDALLMLDRLQTNQRSRRVAAPRLEDLIADYRSEWAKCPANKDGFTRFWMSTHAIDVGAALRGTVGPNLLVVTESIDWFVEISTRLRAYRDWSLFATPEKYPETIMEMIPMAADMKFPPNVGILAAPRGENISEQARGADLIARMDHVTRARVGLAGHAHGGGDISRYHLITLEQAEEHGGATAGAYGPSIGLPSTILKFLDQSSEDLFRTLRLFFAFYDRQAADAVDRLWYDMVLANEFRLVPVYPNNIPEGRRVRQLGRCALALPALLQEPDANVRKSVRPVRQALLSLFSMSTQNAGVALTNLEGAVDDLAAATSNADLLQLDCVLLSFNKDGEDTTQPVFVISTGS
jgi:tetratricopeptide (TPR) repeat protein